MVTLGAETVEEWLGDCRKFSYEFLHCSTIWHQAIGLFIEFHDELVENAHSEWVRIVNEKLLDHCRSPRLSVVGRGLRHAKYPFGLAQPP